MTPTATRYSKATHAGCFRGWMPGSRGSAAPRSRLLWNDAVAFELFGNPRCNLPGGLEVAGAVLLIILARFGDRPRIQRARIFRRQLERLIEIGNRLVVIAL